MCSVESERGSIISSLMRRRFGLWKGRIQFSELDERNLSQDYCFKQVLNSKSRTRTTFAFAFSSDGKYVASVHGDHKVYVCDTEIGKVMHILTGHPRTPWCVAFHPRNNNLLATGCLAGATIVWHLKLDGRTPPNEPVQAERYQATMEPIKLVSSVAFHPSKRELLIATGNRILFWDWLEKSPHTEVSTKLPSERVTSVQYDPLGRYLLTGITNIVTRDLFADGSQIFDPSVPRFSNTGLRPITIDIINSGQLGPTQTTAATQTEDPILFPHEQTTNSPSQSAAQDHRRESPPGHYNLRNLRRRVTAKFSCNSASTDSTPDSLRHRLENEPCSSSSETQQTDSSLGSLPGSSKSGSKRKSSTPVKGPVGEHSEEEYRSVKRRCLQSSPNALSFASSSAQTCSESPGSVTGSRLRTPNAIRANVYLSEIFPETQGNASLSASENGPSFPLSESDPHGALFHNSFPRNIVKLETEARPGRTSLANDHPFTSDDSTDSPMTSAAVIEESVSAATDNPEDHLRIAVVHCAARQGTSISEATQASDSGYRISVRVHPPIENSLSISSELAGVQVISSFIDEEDIEVHEESAPTHVFANRLIDTLRSTIRTHRERSAQLQQQDPQRVNRRATTSVTGPPGPPSTSATPTVRVSATGRLPTNFESTSSSTDMNEEVQTSIEVNSFPLGAGTQSSSGTARAPGLTRTQVAPGSAASAGGARTIRDVTGTHHIYDVSIFDSRLRPNDAIQDAITRVILGAFAATGDYRRTQQRTTCRLQYWPIDNCPYPDIEQTKRNILVPHCKLLNNSAIDISRDGKIMAVLTPAPPDADDMEDNYLSLYSLDAVREQGATLLAQVLVGPNAISVSLSPSGRYVFVANFAKRITLCVNPVQPIFGEIFEWCPEQPHPMDRLVPRRHIKQPPPNSRQNLLRVNRPPGSAEPANVNCAKWMPREGCGLMYGNTRGELVVCQPLPFPPPFPSSSRGSVSSTGDPHSVLSATAANLLLRLGTTGG